MRVSHPEEIDGTGPTADEPKRAPILLHEVFDAVAKRYAERVAVEVPPGTLRAARHLVTYAQLRDWSDCIAASLASLARPDGVVAILLPRDASALYAAQLGVLKAGAAFTCMDPSFPDEHLAAVLSDAGAVALITDTAGRRRVEMMGGTIPAVIDPGGPAPLPAGAALVPARISPSNLAYVIYTSGTTGKPKGVMIEHRSIVNLVAGDVEYFGLPCTARVAQCSSPAYDSSIEEMWLAFAAGATLVPLDDQTVRLGPDLPAWLARERITVLCPPPTLLRTTGCTDPRQALPELHLLYVGGEALPADLADRWAVGRWMENGYGPTECTVTVVRGRVKPGESVTIGKPVRGSQAWVLDGSLAILPDGEAGELCISGAGLARGYHGREDLTAEKFPVHPVLGRIYRTGDLVRRNPQGNLEYLGRIDAQVKLRGYRIELSAIEAVLAACPGVRSVACKVQGEGSGQLLAAHVVAEAPDNPPAVERLKQWLRRSLPEYMVPARFSFCERLPTTIGGKLDRRALPDIGAGLRDTGREMVLPRSDAERQITAAFRRALNLTEDISVEDDFFLDLGGDSLSAVGVICELRAQSGSIDGKTAPGAAAGLTVRDLYESRTAAQMAARSTGRECVQPMYAAAVPSSAHGNPVRSTLIQTLWILVELVVTSAVAAGLLLLILPRLLGDLGLEWGTLLSALAGVCLLLAYLPLSVVGVALLKMMLVGKYTPMRTPVWGGFFTRHWMVTRATRLIPWSLIEGTVFACVTLRVLGAKVGRRVHIHRGVDLRRGGWDLLTIGDDVTLAQDVALRPVELEAGHLAIGPITIGNGATLDVRAGMSPGSSVGDGGYLAPLSWLAGGSHIAPGRAWDGVPAGETGAAPPRPAVTRGGQFTPVIHGTLLVLGRVLQIFAASLPIVLVALSAPLVIPNAEARFLSWIESPRVSIRGLAICCGLAGAGVATALALSAVAARAMGRVAPGVVSQWSGEALRIWAKTALLDSAGRWLSGSMFWPLWLRLAGMRVGRGCEISTIIDVLPETIRIGRESFFADGIYLCAPWRHRGTITVARSTLGRGTFLGNHAVIPGGHRWPDGLFVGVSTVADAGQARPGTSWFGHPPMQLPRRQIVAADRSLTHDPGAVRFATRLFWESMRFFLPTVPILIGTAWFVLMNLAGTRVSTAALLLIVAPLLTAGAGLLACGTIVALKWVLLGRMKPGQHAFWSCWCSRWDFLFMAWGFWARGALAALEGTLWLNAFLRLMGVRIGRRVVLGPGFSQVVDPDMLHFGDGATVTCHFQAHSFEDRILKLDHIHIEPGASVGDQGVVFYGARIGPGAVVDPHSVVMKRDVLAEGARYRGAPTRRV